MELQVCWKDSHKIAHCGHFNTVKIGGLVQDCSNSSALAMELLQSYTKSSRLYFYMDSDSYSYFSHILLNQDYLMPVWRDLFIETAPLLEILTSKPQWLNRFVVISQQYTEGVDPTKLAFCPLNSGGCHWH